MKVCIISNGDVNTEHLQQFLSSGEFFIICCDGALRYTKRIGVKPHLLIGDMDSCAKNTALYCKRHNIEIKKFPAEKDFTDTELAMMFACETQPEDIFIFGALGGRFDHALANIHILKHARELNINAFIVDETHIISIKCLASLYMFDLCMVSF